MHQASQDSLYYLTLDPSLQSRMHDTEFWRYFAMNFKSTARLGLKACVFIILLWTSCTWTKIGKGLGAEVGVERGRYRFSPAGHLCREAPCKFAALKLPILHRLQQAAQLDKIYCMLHTYPAMHQALQLFQRVSIIICNAPGIAADYVSQASSLHLIIIIFIGTVWATHQALQLYFYYCLTSMHQALLYPIHLSFHYLGSFYTIITFMFFGNESQCTRHCDYFRIFCF